MEQLTQKSEELESNLTYHDRQWGAIHDNRENSSSTATE